MTILRKIAKAWGYGMAAATLASAVFVSSAANATIRPTPEPILDTPAYDEPGTDTLLCSSSDSRSRTGRQYAIIRPSTRDPSFCLRIKLGGTADNSVPDCWKVARAAALGCRDIVDVN